MQVAEWRKVIGEMVRDHMRSPQLEYYFSLKSNQRRAQIMISQLGLYIRHRRDCWSHVSGNCPVMAIKQKIHEHENGKIIKHKNSQYGYLQLIGKQAQKTAITPKKFLGTKPLATTK